MNQRRKTLLALITLVLVLSFTVVIVVSAQQTFGTNWVGEYFNNPNLSGSPTLTRTDAALSFNWGDGSPAPGQIDPDEFSVRWNTTDTFQQGQYTFTATIDDGIKLFIDNNLVIDQFNAGAIRTVQATVDLSAGTHNLRVEYLENVGDAQLQLSWQLTQAAGPTAVPTAVFTPTPYVTPLPSVPEGAVSVTVIRATVLLVRDGPFLGANVIGRIRRGQTYQIIGRNDNNTWYLLQLSGFQGWAFSYYLNVNGNEFNAPEVSAFTTFNLPGDTGVVGQTHAVMKLRALPDAESEQIGRVPWGQIVPVLGQTPDGLWWQVSYAGTTGWLFSEFLTVIEGDIVDVPIR